MTDKNKTHAVAALLFSAALCAGIVACAVCDFAISGRFTWSLIPISSIIFLWPVCIPLIRYGGRGLLAALVSFSILTVPFLCVLNLRIPADLFLPVGIRMTVIAVPFLWVVYVLLRLLKRRKLIAGIVTLFLVIAASILINFNLSKLTGQPSLDSWDAVSSVITLVSALLLFVLDHKTRKKG